MVKEEKQNALFVQRLVAYIIDVLIISFAVSLIAIPFYDSESIKKLDDTNKEVMDKYLNKKIDVKPMNSEEAMLQMELSGHDFYMYKDSETNNICVLYKRKNGGYGILESE